MLPDFSWLEWAVAVLAAVGVGLAKSGLAGMGLIPVILFAGLFGARDSTGVTLPILIVGDLLAAAVYRQHADRAALGRMLPPACVGVAVGAWALRGLGDTQFRPLLGGITLTLAALHVLRTRWPHLGTHVPHSTGFVWAFGLLAGSTTMLANAAGPMLVIYALAIRLPKLALVGTIGWFFLLINLFKLPFSISLGLLHPAHAVLACVLTPAVVVGLHAGRRVVETIPQPLFNHLLLAGAGLASLRLLGAF